MRSVRCAALAAALFMLCAAASGCGEKKEDLPAVASTPTSAETSAVSAEAAPVTQAASGSDVTDAGETDGHPVLSELAADRIIASLRTEEEKGGSKEYKEILFTLFSDDKGTPYCALITFSKSRKSSTILCGKYTAETSEDEFGTLWTNLNIKDAVTGDEHKIGFAEGEDPNGNYIGFILDENGGEHRAKPISAADTADYVAEALACENAVEEEIPETDSEEAEETAEEETTTVTEETTETETTTVSETTAEETTTTVTETTTEAATTTAAETTAEETKNAAAETTAEEAAGETDPGDKPAEQAPADKAPASGADAAKETSKENSKEN